MYFEPKKSIWLPEIENKIREELKVRFLKLPYIDMLFEAFFEQWRAETNFDEYVKRATLGENIEFIFFQNNRMTSPFKLDFHTNTTSPLNE
jgi:hypothetical protein